MKTSLRKLRGFTLHKHGGASDRRDLRSLSQLDELARASQDLEDMRNCYDSLLAAAAATTNTAFEFAESLGELGSCLLEKTALNDDEESGKVLLMLGKLQFELQKVLDSYRSHLTQTITVPSQSLLNELRTVEDMKQQCDEKREVYNYMVMKQREKDRPKSGKGESISMQQLHEAREQYEEEATLLVFRLKSLKRGQSQSLLTQAARHHAAQLHLFRKALKSLEAVEPHVKLVAQKQHIDYQFNGLEEDDCDTIEEDDDDEDDDDDDDSYDTHDDGELSFDYGQNDDSSTRQHSMELDQVVDLTFPKVATADISKGNLKKTPGGLLASSVDIKSYTQSAPLFADKRPDFADRMAPLRQTSTRKLQTYVLPTPGDPKSSISPKAVDPFPSMPRASLNRDNPKLWHSSPLVPKKHGKSVDERFSGTLLNTQAAPRESDKSTTSTLLPPPLAEGLLFSQFDPLIASSSKKVKRQSFSGPITSKPQLGQQIPTDSRHLYSGPILVNPMSQPPSSSPRASRISSPPLTSSPRINELHELPRPPVSSTSTSTRPSGFVGYSGPLVPRGRDPYGKNEPTVSNPTSLLPRPPEVLPRSFSIPSSASKEILSQVPKPSVDLLNDEMAEVSSPPLTPISFSNVRIIDSGH